MGSRKLRVELGITLFTDHLACLVDRTLAAAAAANRRRR